jgi:hypothetical protein
MASVAASIAIAYAMAMHSWLDGQFQRFPPPEVVKAFVALNEEHGEWLEQQINFWGPVRGLLDWRRENFHYLLYWQSVQSAQNTGRRTHARIRDLAKLSRISKRHPFGPGLPPPVPIWRFREGSPPPAQTQPDLMKSGIPL